VPVLTSEVLARFLDLSRTLPSPEWLRAVTDWALTQRPPAAPTP
jgi:hypothetical protein